MRLRGEWTSLTPIFYMQRPKSRLFQLSANGTLSVASFVASL